jgi:hypothetical protein
MISSSQPSLDLLTPLSHPSAAKEQVNNAIREVISSLPDPKRLSPEERRALIGRYTAVLEGNFIYWMTAAYLSVKSLEAHSIIEENLREEVRDNHPGMLRRFAMAAHAMPSESDALAVNPGIQNVRQFLSGMCSVQILLLMAFFEGFIHEFMAYLGDLATMQGSMEHEYTDVHGVVDVLHTQELFRAFAAEMAVTSEPPAPSVLFEGVEILRSLVEKVIHHHEPRHKSQSAT